MVKMMLALLCFIHVTIKLAIGIYVGNTLHTQPLFRQGCYSFSSYSTTNASKVLAFNLLGHCFNNVTTTLHVNDIILSMYGLSIMELESVKSKNVFDKQESFEISHQLNSCAIGASNEHKEIYLHSALAMSPSNVVAAKNLGFILEWSGHVSVAKSLYIECANVSGDKGCRLHAALVAPTIQWDAQQCSAHYVHTLSSLFDILRRDQIAQLLYDDWYSEQINSPSVSLREVPLNVQYLGRGPNIVNALFSAALLKSYPQLGVVNVLAEKAATTSGSRPGGAAVITIGVVSGQCELQSC